MTGNCRLSCAWLEQIGEAPEGAWKGLGMRRGAALVLPSTHARLVSAPAPNVVHASVCRVEYTDAVIRVLSLSRGASVHVGFAVNPWLWSSLMDAVYHILPCCKHRMLMSWSRWLPLWLLAPFCGDR